MKCKQKLPKFLFKVKDEDGQLKNTPSYNSVFREMVKSNLINHENNYTK